jgi:hypothetical protein
VYGVSGRFSYTVDQDNSFIMLQNLTVDNGVSVSGIVQRGWIGHGGKTLVISDVDDNEEEVTTSTGSSFLRECGRSGTAIKVSKD